MANRVKIAICGTEYTVNTEESEDYIRTLSQEINRKFVKLMEAGKMSQTMAASIAALQFCDDAKKHRIECEELKAKAAAEEELKTEAEIKLREALAEIERLSRENRAILQKLNKQ